ncbi:MAG: 2-oxoacid:acceptor oxidoreductase family protein, partial [Polaromonas sp.]|nr:2-oxoacid:acceptor oxidoreductase family protein [Polaromonas sp.]
AQKGGATWSHVLIGANQDDIRTTRVGMAGADLIIGCDPIVAAGKETVLRMREGRTHVALNSYSTPTAAFVHNANWQNPADACAAEIVKAVGVAGVGAFNADAASTKLMGDSIYTNPMMLGYAWQKGWIPLEYASLMRAIELNAVAVDNNKTAFEWGRRAAHDLPSVEKLFASAQVIAMPTARQSLADLVAKRVAFLTDYQNAAYAQAYETLVNRVEQAESALGKTLLSQNVARYLFKLMAYKDEYEVARLHTDRSFHDKVGAMFEGDFKLNYHLAPPLMAKKNDKGELQKQAFGPWMLSAFRVLARLKGLRGTALDPFGRTEERRMERALIKQYEASIEELLQTLDAGNHAAAVEVARIPELIKGYGHVKARHLKQAQVQWAEAMRAFRHPVSAPHRIAA